MGSLFTLSKLTINVPDMTYSWEKYKKVFKIESIFNYISVNKLIMCSSSQLMWMTSSHHLYG